MDDSRGQIILVAALAIAVTFVALALVVNTVIFTENLATRETVRGGEAVEFQQMVEESGEALLWRANEYNNSSYSDAKDAFERDIGLLGQSENLHAVSGGSLRSVDVVTVHEGARIEQSSQQGVTETTGNSTWVVATDVTDTRAFQLHITGFSGDEFTVNVSKGSEEWRMRINDSGGSPTVYTSDETGAIGDCSASGTPVTVGVTAGTVNGSECSTLDFAEGVSTPYRITIENGTNVTASYQLVVDETRSSVSGATDTDYSGGGEPELYHAIYNSTVNISVERSDLTYTSNVTLAPERNPAP